MTFSAPHRGLRSSSHGDRVARRRDVARAVAGANHECIRPGCQADVESESKVAALSTSSRGHALRASGQSAADVLAQVGERRGDAQLIVRCHVVGPGACVCHGAAKNRRRATRACGSLREQLEPLTSGDGDHRSLPQAHEMITSTAMRRLGRGSLCTRRVSGGGGVILGDPSG